MVPQCSTVQTSVASSLRGRLGSVRSKLYAREQAIKSSVCKFIKIIKCFYSEYEPEQRSSFAFQSVLHLREACLILHQPAHGGPRLTLTMVGCTTLCDFSAESSNHTTINAGLHMRKIPAGRMLLQIHSTRVPHIALSAWLLCVPETES